MLIAALFASALAQEVEPPAAPEWPMPFEKVYLYTADMNGDGHLDIRATETFAFETPGSLPSCVKDGHSGDIACRSIQPTPESHFSTDRLVVTPTQDNKATALLMQTPCAEPSQHHPAQAAMWRLTQAAPRKGNLVIEPIWFPGVPALQAPVCLPNSVAKTLGYQVPTASNARYDPDWNSMAPLGRTTFHLWTAEDRVNPVRIVVSDEIHVYQLRHAIAVYNPRLNAHTWVLNIDQPSTAVTVGREDRIMGVTFEGSGALKLAVTPRTGSEPTYLTIEWAGADPG